MLAGQTVSSQDSAMIFRSCGIHCPIVFLFQSWDQQGQTRMTVGWYSYAGNQLFTDGGDARSDRICIRTYHDSCFSHGFAACMKSWANKESCVLQLNVSSMLSIQLRYPLLPPTSQDFISQLLSRLNATFLIHELVWSYTDTHTAPWFDCQLLAFLSPAYVYSSSEVTCFPPRIHSFNYHLNIPFKPSFWDSVVGIVGMFCRNCFNWAPCRCDEGCCRSQFTSFFNVFCVFFLLSTSPKVQRHRSQVVKTWIPGVTTNWWRNTLDCYMLCCPCESGHRAAWRWPGWERGRIVFPHLWYRNVLRGCGATHRAHDAPRWDNRRHLTVRRSVIVSIFFRCCLSD